MIIIIIVIMIMIISIVRERIYIFRAKFLWRVSVTRASVLYTFVS